MAGKTRALVTGATGLVGSHIVDQLLAEGSEVRALVRSPSPQLAARGVETVVGDVLDEASFVRAALGRDEIFHTAAMITPRGGWEAFRRPNVDGTTNAVKAAEQSGARLLHLSSVAVYSGRYAKPGQRLSEDAELGPLPENAYYARSKRASEEIVLDAHARGRIWATAVRPCVIYGVGDRQFIPRIAGILDVGIAPVLGAGTSTMPIVAAPNVAQGALLAVRSDRAGGRAFNVANDFDVTLRDFYRFASEGLGRRIRTFTVPTPVAYGVFRVSRALARVLSPGTANVVSSGALDMATRDNPYSSDLARRELGWRPATRPEDALVAAFRDAKARRR